MSEPTFSRVVAAPFADVTVRAEVADAEPLRTAGGRLMLPTVIEARYYFDFSTARWRHQVTLNGRLTQGVTGSMTKIVFEHASQEMPRWLATFVRQYAPSSILPDLRMVNA